MEFYEVLIEREDGMFQALIKAENKSDLTKILKEKYPEDVGADAISYDPDGEEFAIKW